MKNLWSLYVAGVGSYDAVSDMLTSFVSTLRDAGLTITSANVIKGDLHPNLADLEDAGQDGWQFYVLGEGDMQIAYGEFPAFLQNLKNADAEIVGSGITVGAPVEISV